MIRKSRVLGLALVAMLAISAWVAAAAQAETKFVAGNGTGTAKFKVEQDSSSPIQVLKTDLGSLECEVLHAEGTGNATTTGVTLTGVGYEECEFSSTGLAVAVNFSACHYVIHANGGLDLGPAGCEVKVLMPNCTLVIAGEQDLLGLNYTNVQESGKKKKITASSNVENIHYSWSGTSCPYHSGPGSATNGVLSGKFSVRATDNSNNPIDLAVVSRFRAGNGTGTAKITLEQESTSPLQALTMTPDNVECKEVHAEGTGNATASGLELSNVAYKECPNRFGLQMGVNFNTCHYAINAEGSIDLGPAGCKVQITDSECLITLEGSQVFGSTAITYTNVQESGKPKEVIAHMKFSGIQYAWNGHSCLGGVEGAKSNGAYDGTVRLKAFTPGGTQEDLTVE